MWVRWYTVIINCFVVEWKKFAGNFTYLIRRLFLCLCCLCLISACQQNNEKASPSILVFAAASLRDVMQEIAEVYEQQTGITVIFNFAGSNVLARQIAASTQADVFLSANTQWMDYLAEKNLIEMASQRQFLSNSLVFIAHEQSEFELATANKLLDLSFRYLAIGDPQAVPAGRYAKTYLRSQNYNHNNLWSALSGKILPAPDVKAASTFVATMPDVIGLVYKTDALVSSKTRILFEPAIGDIPQIQYVAARIKKNPSINTDHQATITGLSHSKAIEFLKFLEQTHSTNIFQKHGFITLAEKQKTNTTRIAKKGL